MTPRLKDAIDNIMDCFTGADGGVAFIMLRNMLDTIEDSHLRDDDEASKALLSMVFQFSRLIDVAKTTRISNAVHKQT